MNEKKFDWYKVQGPITELEGAETLIIEAEVNGKKICLTKYNDQYYGFANKCPHASGFLANGSVDYSGNIVCPVHGYKFNLKNGRNTSGEGFYLKTYPVEIRADGLYVGIEEGGVFHLIY